LKEEKKIRVEGVCQKNREKSKTCGEPLVIKKLKGNASAQSHNGNIKF